jgi:hypothetical protein
MKSCTKGIGEADPWDFGWSICVASAGLPWWGSAHMLWPVLGAQAHPAWVCIQSHHHSARIRIGLVLPSCLPTPQSLAKGGSLPPITIFLLRSLTYWRAQSFPAIGTSLWWA